MPWFKVDDAAAFHPKIVKAGNAAVGAWVRLGAYCNAYHLNGKIETSAALDIGTQKEIDSLVAVGLLHSVEGGYELHDYLKYQASKEEITKKREEARIRMERSRSRSREQTSNKRSNNERTNAFVLDGIGSGDSSEIPDRVEPLADRITMAVFFAAWQKAGLGPMQDGQSMDELRRALNASDLDPDPEAYCIAWKQISASWRKKMPTSGEGPALMLRHLDKCHLVVSGQMDPSAAPQDNGRRAQEPSRPAPKVFDGKYAYQDDGK